MRKLNKLAIFVLAAAVSGLGQGTGAGSTPDQQQPAQQPAAGQTTGAPAQPQQKKEIKDPAEYNAYVSAIGLQNPQQKAAALQQFLQQYPSTVMKEDAEQQIMVADQQAAGADMQQGNQSAAQKDAAAAMQAAQAVMQANPNNLPALLVLAADARQRAQAGGDPQAAGQALQYGEKGLQALPNYAPEGMAPADLEKLKAAGVVVFNGAAGIGAFAQRDYANAQKYLLAAIDGNPNDLANIYPLTITYLESKPLNPLGFWWGAKAINLAASNPQIKAQIEKYALTKYENYHGSDDGWATCAPPAAGATAPPCTPIMQQAATENAPPPGFTVTQETPATQAAKLYQEAPINGNCKNGDPATWEFLFQNADPNLTDKCLGEIKGQPFAFEAKVISATDTELMLAAAEDDIASNTADTQVTMAAAIPVKIRPKVGSMTGVQAIPVSYDKQPYMLHMEQGKLVTTHKPAPTHRRPHRSASQQ